MFLIHSLLHTGRISDIFKCIFLLYVYIRYSISFLSLVPPLHLN